MFRAMVVKGTQNSYKQKPDRHESHLPFRQDDHRRWHRAGEAVQGFLQMYGEAEVLRRRILSTAAAVGYQGGLDRPYVQGGAAGTRTAFFLWISCVALLPSRVTPHETRRIRTTTTTNIKNSSSNNNKHKNNNKNNNNNKLETKTEATSNRIRRDTARGMRVQNNPPNCYQ